LIYSLLVMSPPTSGHTCLTAARFAHAALARGHSIHRVFFLDEGTRCGSSHNVVPQDESDALTLWQELKEQHGVELIICISSAIRRGMLDDTEAQRYEKNGATVHPAFEISGLGQLVDACNSAARLVTFGG
jgi:tRNA 2-thiouridine synthesizing protein D